MRGQARLIFTGILKLAAKITTMVDINTELAIAKLIVNAGGSGAIDDTFDGYVPAGDTLTWGLLAGGKLKFVILNGVILQDFSVSSNSKISQSTDDDTVIDFTNAGGLVEDDWLILVFTKLTNVPL